MLHMNESWYTYENVMSHVNESWYMYEGVMSHMNESWYTYEGVMSQVFTKFVCVSLHQTHQCHVTHR